MTEQPTTDEAIDFGYATALAGTIAAAVLTVVMFATSGQV